LTGQPTPRRLLVASDLGRMVRERRREHGLTQQALADLIDAHRTLVGKVEQDGAVRLDTALRVVQTLGMDLFLQAR
jgi:transcriptional regulator with XRE-family HTH domain